MTEYVASCILQLLYFSQGAISGDQYIIWFFRLLTSCGFCRMLEKVCKDPQMLVDIFVNYDCDLEAPNLFERTVLLHIVSQNSAAQVPIKILIIIFFSGTRNNSAMEFTTGTGYFSI